jgi:hypothetical protein
MKIQSIYFFLLLILFSNSSFSQINLDTLDDGNRISIQSYIPPQVEGLTPIIESQLKNMLNQIIVKNGFGNNSADNRFILTPHIDILSKEITSTAPPAPYTPAQSRPQSAPALQVSPKMKPVHTPALHLDPLIQELPV